jgi:hypothetical protein
VSRAAGRPHEHDLRLPPVGWFLTQAGAGPGRSRRKVPAPLARAASLELRWFGRDAPPEELVRFTGSVSTEVRTDRYARVDRDDVSIKLRGRARLGLKQRRCRIVVDDRLPPAERWSRRSARTNVDPDREGDWVSLHKRRRRILFDLAGDDPVQVSSGRSSFARGGAIELVELRWDDAGERLWSVACESWGPHDRDDLVRLLSWAGIDWTAVHVRSWRAGGYAAMLRRRSGETPPGG